MKESPNFENKLFAIFCETSKKSMELSPNCNKLISSVPNSLFLQI
ncbi:hypothetical protein T4B_9316 [Trichinella pseudospiralis]|uniref:Uncharacterized protein n=1 Tax=Trichinella pseudospiralis TaxID=6337 RepID=A0A0V1GMV0_TRIPS|nr:hypothetical protein T4B_12679 [Trichinella pseudospiralis]KRY99655.1 hypothetical protein T4B_9316 [Trichinella pseudospiralis]KRZ19896.1 hypothetical protein T4C_2982 [Trichinella pseudospiralis]